MRIPKARILKYAAMGIIAAFIATFFLKKEKQQGHPRDYAEIAAEKIIRAATEYNSISFYVDGDTLSGFHYELIEAFARDHGWKAAITPEMSFDKRLEGLATGEFDVIAYGILATSELKDSLLLTTPIVLNKQVQFFPAFGLCISYQLEQHGMYDCFLFRGLVAGSGVRHYVPRLQHFICQPRPQQSAGNSDFHLPHFLGCRNRYRYADGRIYRRNKYI